MMKKTTSSSVNKGDAIQSRKPSHVTKAFDQASKFQAAGKETKSFYVKSRLEVKEQIKSTRSKLNKINPDNPRQFAIDLLKSSTIQLKQEGEQLNDYELEMLQSFKSSSQIVDKQSIKAFNLLVDRVHTSIENNFETWYSDKNHFKRLACTYPKAGRRFKITELPETDFLRKMESLRQRVLSACDLFGVVMMLFLRYLGDFIASLGCDIEQIANVRISGNKSSRKSKRNNKEQQVDGVFARSSIEALANLSSMDSNGNSFKNIFNSIVKFCIQFEKGDNNATLVVPPLPINTIKKRVQEDEKEPKYYWMRVMEHIENHTIDVITRLLDVKETSYILQGNARNAFIDVVQYKTYSRVKKLGADVYHLLRPLVRCSGVSRAVNVNIVSRLATNVLLNQKLYIMKNNDLFLFEKIKFALNSYIEVQSKENLEKLKKLLNQIIMASIVSSVSDTKKKSTIQKTDTLHNALNKQKKINFHIAIALLIGSSTNVQYYENVIENEKEIENENEDNAERFVYTTNMVVALLKDFEKNNYLFDVDCLINELLWVSMHIKACGELPTLAKISFKKGFGDFTLDGEMNDKVLHAFYSLLHNRIRNRQTFDFVEKRANIIISESREEPRQLSPIYKSTVDSGVVVGLSAVESEKSPEVSCKKYFERLQLSPLHCEYVGGDKAIYLETGRCFILTGNYLIIPRQRVKTGLSLIEYILAISKKQSKNDDEIYDSDDEYTSSDDEVNDLTAVDDEEQYHSRFVKLKENVIKERVDLQNIHSTTHDKTKVVLCCDLGTKACGIVELRDGCVIDTKSTVCERPQIREPNVKPVITSSLANACGLNNLTVAVQKLNANIYLVMTMFCLESTSQLKSFFEQKSNYTAHVLEFDLDQPLGVVDAGEVVGNLHLNDNHQYSEI